MVKGGTLRARALLHEWFGVAVLGLLVVAAVGGVLAHGAYVDPGTHQEQRVTDEWSVNGSFSHHSTVRNASFDTAFDPGTTVRDRSVYFQRIMPVLAGNFTFGSPGAEAPINLTIDRRLVVESVGDASGDTGSSTVYWRETRTLGIDRTVHQPGDATRVPFRANVTRTLEEANNVSAQLQSPGEIRTEILVTAEVMRQTEGAQMRRFTFSLPITPESGIYRVESSPTVETFTKTKTITVENEPTAIQRYGGPLVALLGLLGVLGLAFARYRGSIALSEAEREWLAYRDDRAEFDEWISSVRLPDEAEDLPIAEAETLADLVDVAIDSDNPVLESPDGEAYHVVHDGYRYTFAAPSDPVSDDPLALGETDPADEDSLSNDDSPPSSDNDPLAAANGGQRPVDGSDE